MTLETSVHSSLKHLTRLQAREYFIEISDSENCKLYARNLEVIVQYGTTASVAGNSKFYNVNLKLLKNNLKCQLNATRYY